MDTKRSLSTNIIVTVAAEDMCISYHMRVGRFLRGTGQQAAHLYVHN